MTDRGAVLIVEDQMLIGLDLAFVLRRAGLAVEGPHTTSRAALEAIAKRPPVAAVLDINLGRGDTSEPVAEALEVRSVPFVFVTGYSVTGSALPARFPEAEVLRKPIDHNLLICRLREHLDLPKN